MSVYGASFVKVKSEPGASFDATYRLLDEANSAWLASSPEHLATKYTIRMHPGTPWLSIENTVNDDMLRQLARELSCETLSIWTTDEHRLEFHYAHYSDGETLRVLSFGQDVTDPRAMGRWRTVEGEREPWEEILFSPQLMATYEKFALMQELDAAQTISVGARVPWACDGGTVQEIAAYLQLPWAPLKAGFPIASRCEVVRGRP